MKKVTIYIAVKIPPGAESKVELDWVRDDQVLLQRCKLCKKFNQKTRVEIVKVEVDI